MSAEFVAIPWEGGSRSHAPLAPPAGLGYRGFGIYVGIDEHRAADAGVDIGALVDDVQRALTDIPGAETFASIVLGPETDAPPLTAVRTALGEPSARRAAAPTPPAGATPPKTGLHIDLDRHRVCIDGSPVRLTYREQALLDHLVRNQGVTHDRPALLAALAAADGTDDIGERTIDVYLQRLRRRLAPYGEVIRTIRRRGYRLDPHPDVTIVGGNLR
ncbi:winged helix-turn-helix domain-containing protein [Salinibacterium sp. ZJ77]|uniref:winged helix-turn-helix domain-containing protein n=1 Tax=Salinibacterium sp. ZJ77 TaxID=2708337 RepID=UPI0014224758|nr:winged helix-turn-helix domain-containing protein [Salinibacterium sp. ZJ77]